MKNPWFRMYAEFATDPKVQSMSFDMQRHLIMLFCLKCNDDLDGLSEDEIAFALRLTIEELGKCKQIFVSKGFTDEHLTLVNWEKRQFTAERKQQIRHCEKRQAIGLTRRRWINPKIRETVLARDARACVYCASETNLTLDHIIPEIKGGTNTAENLVTACRSCNGKKREFTIEQAGMRYREGYIPPQGIARVKQGSSKGQARTDTDTDTDTEQPIEVDTSIVPEAVASGTPEKPPPKRGDKSPPCPHQEILVLYRHILPELPQIEWTEDRAVQLRTRWREKPERQCLGWWEKYFELVKRCPWLMGENDRGWIADFEWLTRKKNLPKVLDGKYLSRDRPESGYSKLGQKNLLAAQAFLKMKGNENAKH